MTTYDDTTALAEIADWYLGTLGTRREGPDLAARMLLVELYAQAAGRAAADPSPVKVAEARTMGRVLLVLADAERESGRPGWQERWTEVYEDYV
ncbi:hypothetical protein ABZ714_30830 [Streptomyces sp. NPDC006798]|uniref:hypothetical protein n=1 Tax=Streptomyces sp. NPDC006798 TaxID=3155462 RepID=UPI003401B682